MDADNINLTQTIITLVLAIGSSGALGGLLLRYLRIQLDEASSSLKDRETMRKANEDLLDIISKLSSGIEQRNEIQRSTSDKHIQVLQSLINSIDGGSRQAIDERLAIKADTTAIMNEVSKIGVTVLSVRDIVTEIKEAMNG